METLARILAGLVLAVGMIGAGLLTKDGLENFRRPTGEISVQGVVEEPAKSDMVIWKVAFFASGVDLEQAMEKAQLCNEKVGKFLEEESFSKEAKSIIPKSSVEFRDNKTIYDMIMGLLITTMDVDRQTL